MRKNTLILLAISLFLIQITVLAAVPTAKVIDGIKARFEKIQDFKSDIKQIQLDGIGTKTVFQGEIYYKKPYQIRMNYMDTQKNTPTHIAITDSKTLWQYTAELKQVTRQKFDPNSLPLPLLILGSASKIDDQFREKNYIKPIERVTLDKKSVFQIIVKPKNGNKEYKEQTLWVSTDTYLPYKAELKYNQGNVATIFFTNIKTNVGIEDSKFVMEKMNGVKVVDMVEK